MTIDFFVPRRERAAEGLRQNARTDYEWSFYKDNPSRQSVITHSRWWITLPFFDQLVLFPLVITPSRYFRLILRSPWQKNQWMFERLWMADLCERIRTEWMMYKVKMSKFSEHTARMSLCFNICLKQREVGGGGGGRPPPPPLLGAPV